MAKRLTFKDFKELLEKSASPISNLGDYVEFEPESPIPKLIFKSDTLLDDPDPEYNVDHAIYDYLRKIRDEKLAQTQETLSDSPKTVVAIGDSWFKLPYLLRCCAPAIVDCLDQKEEFQIVSDDVEFGTIWGKTLTDILNEKKYMISLLEDNTPNFFLLSAGGNDLVEGLAKKGYVYRYNSKRAYDDYLTEKGKEGIADIETGYKDILDEVTKEFPNLKVLCHGYDYPKPRPVIDEIENGPGDNISDEAEDGSEDEVKCDEEFIGNHLHDLGIPYDEMDAILRPILNKLNDAIKAAVKQYEPSVKFIDLRGVASKPEIKWYDDMHPGEEGFKALAAKFEQAMSSPGPLV